MKDWARGMSDAGMDGAERLQYTFLEDRAVQRVDLTSSGFSMPWIYPVRPPSAFNCPSCKCGGPVTDSGNRQAANLNLPAVVAFRSAKNGLKPRAEARIALARSSPIRHPRVTMVLRAPGRCTHRRLPKPAFLCLFEPLVARSRHRSGTYTGQKEAGKDANPVPRRVSTQSAVFHMAVQGRVPDRMAGRGPFENP
jgi:hypothetical protein